MEQITESDLIEIAERISQDLQEYCDAASEAGNRIKSSEELLAEWNNAHLKYNNQTWTNALVNSKFKRTDKEKKLACLR